MKEKIVIRRATLKDLKEIQRLSRLLFEKEYKEYDKSLDSTWNDGEGKKYFKNRITSKNGFVEVAELKDKVIGYLCGGLYERRFYRVPGVYAELDNMFIEKRYRGSGVGTSFSRDFVAWCKTKKVRFIAVTASAKNKHAISFYRKVGFKDYNLTLEMMLKS